MIRVKKSYFYLEKILVKFNTLVKSQLFGKKFWIKKDLYVSTNQSFSTLAKNVCSLLSQIKNLNIVSFNKLIWHDMALLANYVHLRDSFLW